MEQIYGGMGASLEATRSRFIDRLRALGAQGLAPLVLAAIAFAVLFAQPFVLLVRDWWELPEAGHGLLLAPVALWLAWRAGVHPEARANRRLGIALLVAAVLVRYASGLAAELFTMRASMLLAVVALTVFHLGVRQVMHWWLPFTIAALSIPLPELVTQALALPLQFQASEMGAAMLQWRDIPVRLNGNVIKVPGNELFVTEACSGLRSLTALLSLAVLLGGIWFRSPVTRSALVFIAIPIAVLINGVRVFLTGFLVVFVSPELGKGFMHVTEGWLLFLVSLVALGSLAWIGVQGERLFYRFREARHA